MKSGNITADQGLIAQEYIAGRPPNTYEDLLFLANFNNGVNGQTTAIDQGILRQPITFRGKAQLTTAYSKWGTTSLALPFTLNSNLNNSTFGKVTIPWNYTFENTLHNGDCTAECWFLPDGTNFPFAGYLFSMSSGPGVVLLANTIQPYWSYSYLYSNVFAYLASGIGTSPVWYHIAICRRGGIVRSFVNGVMKTKSDSGADPEIIPGSTSTIGSTGIYPQGFGMQIGGPSNDFSIPVNGATYGGGSIGGYMDSLRITARALYPDDTTSSTPFTLPSGPWGAPLQVYSAKITKLGYTGKVNTPTTDPDILPPPSVVAHGQTFPLQFIDSDTIPVPWIHNEPQILSPLVVDHAPPGASSMPPPTLISSGPLAGVSQYFYNTFVSAPLPSARVFGNLLISFITCYGDINNISGIRQAGEQDDKPDFIVPPTWTKLLEVQLPNSSTKISSPITFAAAYRLIDGTETSCEWVPTRWVTDAGAIDLINNVVLPVPANGDFTSFSISHFMSQTFQFAGAEGLQPIGSVFNTIYNFPDPNWPTSFTTASPLTTEFDNSLVLAFMRWFDPGNGIYNTGYYEPSVTAPTPYTELSYNAQSPTNGANGISTSLTILSEPVSAQGPADPMTFNLLFPIAGYQLMAMEVKGGLISGGDDVSYTPSLTYNPQLIQNISQDFTASTAIDVTFPITLSDQATFMLQQHDLFLHCVQVQAGNQIFTVTNTDASNPNTWTVGGTNIDANTSSIWMWKLLSKDESTFVPGGFFSSPDTTKHAYPHVTWQTSAISKTKCFQFRGANWSTPIGATASNFGSTSPITLSGITTTKNYSAVLAILMTKTNQSIPIPTNYTNAAPYQWGIYTVDNDTYGSFRGAYETQQNSGTTADNISVAITATNWKAFMIEIKSN
jgi:hypothetical protein